MRAPPSFLPHVSVCFSIPAARVFFKRQPFLCRIFLTNHTQKKLSLARVPIMFKRLFGQPSSSSSSNRNNNNNNTNLGSTSSGRAAFDAVDKLKDVRIFVLKSVSLSVSFDELDERRLRAFLFSLSFSLLYPREVFSFCARLSRFVSLSLCR